MKKVHVDTGNAYDVTIGRGLLDKAGEWLAALTPSRLASLVADDTVDALYGSRVAAAL